MKKRTKKKGFTLIELIVVIAILGILAAIAVPRLTGFQTSAKKKSDIATAKTIATAAATLVADQKIPNTMGTTDAPIVITNGTTSTDPTTIAADVATSAKYIRSYLQSVPNNITGASLFNVVITNGDVQVYGNTTDATNLLFPTQGSNY